jgi:hypothetical protein
MYSSGTYHYLSFISTVHNGYFQAVFTKYRSSIKGGRAVLNLLASNQKSFLLSFTLQANIERLKSVPGITVSVSLSSIYKNPYSDSCSWTAETTHHTTYSDTSLGDTNLLTTESIQDQELREYRYPYACYV